MIISLTSVIDDSLLSNVISGQQHNSVVIRNMIMINRGKKSFGEGVSCQSQLLQSSHPQIT